MRLLVAGLTWIPLFLVLSQAVHAQTAQPSDIGAGGGNGHVLDEIVVTSEKRETNLQTTATAISVVSGEDLLTHSTSDVLSVSQELPNVHFGESEGMAQIAIRGLGFDDVAVGGEARVAYHQDGIYLSRPDNILGTLFDVSRIEVLRGPQGTLYGRNATAGAINVITNDPTDETSGYVNTTVGSYDLFKVEGAVAGSLAPGLSGRIAINSVDRDGYGHDLATGADVENDHEKAVRGKLKYQDPSKALTVVLSGDFLNERDRSVVDVYSGAGGFSTTGSPVTPSGLVLGGSVANTRNPFDIDENLNPNFRRYIYGFSANTTYQLDDYTLTSITGYRDSEYSWSSDFDMSTAPISQINIYEKAEQTSEELRLSRSFFDRVRIDVGGYFFHENLFGYTNVPFNREIVGLPSLDVIGYWSGGTIKTNAEAGFFNVNYDVTSQWTLTVGGRYSNETKHIEQGIGDSFTTPFVPTYPALPMTQQSASWDSFNPRVTLAFKPGPGAYTYLTYTTGFKSGGFNLGSPQPPFAPEKLTDYEGGAKIDWLDGRLRTNFSIFYYEYKNLQVNEITSTIVEIVNAASATLKGIEGDVSFIPATNWLFTFDASLLSSRYNSFLTEDASRPALGTLNLAGNRLTDAPPYKADVTGQYTWHPSIGDLSLQGQYTGTGKVYFTPYNLDNTAQSSYSKYNAFLTLSNRDKGLSETLFVRNIGNTTVYTERVVDSALIGSPITGNFEPPRTFGVILNYKF